MRRFPMAVAALAAAALSLLACTGPSEPAPTSIAVFVPGVVAGSPTYEQLVSGVAAAVEKSKGATYKVIEAGYDQAKWEEKLEAVAASGQFGLVVTTNPSLPELCAKVAADFPKLRFFVADGWLPGNPAVHTVLYNQYEQAWIDGYLAGLVSADPAAGRGPAKAAALVVAQRYPTLDKLIEPGFRAGLEAAAPGARCEVRVIGNWYDAAKAQALARTLFAEGSAIILPIAGGAGQGVLAAARESGRPALWFDSSGYDLAPGVVVGSAVIRQERLVREKVGEILAGRGGPFWGKAEIVNAAQGYVDFDESGEAYKALPAELRAAFEAKLAELRKGSLAFPITGL